MLIENNKIHLNKRFSCVEVDFNTIPEVILAHILNHIYNFEITSCEDMNFDNVLFITDKALPKNTHHITLESTDFKECGNTNINRMYFPKRITTANAYEFIEDFTDIDYSDKTLIVIGFINNINEEVFETIKRKFTGIQIVAFGDPIVDNPENANYHMRYLTNASSLIKTEYDTSKLSTKKKLNNTLMRFRKDNMTLSDISNSNVVTIEHTSRVDINKIDDFLETDPLNTVVVPKRMYTELNSMLYEKRYYETNLDLQEGRYYYTKYHTALYDKEGVPFILPPMSKVQIGFIHRSIINTDGNKIVLCDLFLDNGKGEGPDSYEIIEDVQIDFLDYVMNFSPEMHTSNMEDYELINELYFNDRPMFIRSPRVMKLLPFRIVVSEQCKYFVSNCTLSFIESIERHSAYKTDTSWYKHFATTLNELYIITSDEFDKI